MTTIPAHVTEDIQQLEERIRALAEVVEELRPETLDPIYLDVKVYASDAVELDQYLFNPDALKKVAPDLPVHVIGDSITRENKLLWCQLAFTDEWTFEHSADFGALRDSVRLALEALGDRASVAVNVERIALCIRG